MQQTFFQKVLLHIGAGFLAACLLYVFNHSFEGADVTVPHSMGKPNSSTR